MIDEKAFQTDLFTYIKSQQPNGNSFVDEVSEVLSISTDSAYRRIRGDKFMVLPELIRLCEHFEVPLNELVEVSNNKLVSFRTSFIGDTGNTVNKFLKSIYSEMERVNVAEEGRFTFLINDLNLFQFLQIPELAAFKFYFWQKSGLGAEDLQDKKFSFENFKVETGGIIEDIIRAYLNIETVELFTSDLLSSAQKQILYYHDMGFLENRDQTVLLLEKLIEAADHLCKQAELGRKFAFGYEPDPTNGEFKFYYNNLMTVDNIILGEYDGEVVSYLTNNLINVMKSTNRAFFEYNQQVVRNLIQRSELISGTAERNRTRIFKSIKDSVKLAIDQL